MNAIEEFGLNSDPFAITVSDISVHRWAGREREKMILLDVVDSVRASDIGSSEFVIVHGEYGAGKSHALRYLATKINEDEADHYKGKAIYLQTVRVSQKVQFIEIYKIIIDQLGKNFFQYLAAHVSQQVNQAKVDYLHSVAPEVRPQLMADQNRHMNETLDEMAPKSAIPYIKLLMAASNGGVDRVWSFLRGDDQVFPEIGLSSRINNDYNAVSTLAGIFKTMTAKIGSVAPAYEAVYLFVDEQENLVEMKAVESVQLLQSFRELINQLPNYFCMIWGFSADAALIEAILPIAILQRLTRKYIELPTMQPEEAKNFILEQLIGFRRDGFEPPSPYYPFAEEAIDAALERIIEMTPRNIFKVLRAVLERAIRRYDLTPPNVIDAELANKILDLQT
ncbi:ATP-binding protein [Burkholderia multivorans]|uniref:ATP-binding protein n=1 Tax=Burkholderia ubonensis TaxID=101571 RepID=UPI000F6E2A0C|nr:ATP-binding protein [Burkholderia ubonensis]AYZ66752.1 ATP-binding protein [Burkholderia multivorans]VWB46328.1 hypothetical protein BUB20358_02084 [Burkholderia ubonensis]